MAKIKAEENGYVENKSLALGLGLGMIFLVCVSLVWGFVFKDSITSYFCPAPTIGKMDNSDEKSAIAYKTFSSPEAYFTFEYPSTWVYDKHSPTDPYDETLYTFYKDAGKKEVAMTLNYPMYETAMDTCIKFEETTDYTHEHIATNDPGTYINYMTCGGGTKSESNDIFWGEDSMGDIFWQKGVWDGDKEIKSDEKTQVRIHWNGNNNTNIVTKAISDHIAHSIKIVK